MFARIAISALALASLGAAPVQLPTAEANAAFTPQALAAACQGKDGWAEPAPPAHIYGNTWYVGTCGITALLVTTPEGHVLVDAGVPEAAPLVAANIERLGFSLRDVRWIVGSHEHFDHAGGIPKLQRRTGARIAGIAPWAKVITSGHPDRADPQYEVLAKHPVERVKVDRIIPSAGKLTLGGVTLTATSTPTHSPGSTSWTWSACEGATCRTITYADSISTISTDGYRFTAHPARVVSIRQGLQRVAGLPCGILITPHPDASNLFERMTAGLEAQPSSCAAYAKAASARFDLRLAAEGAAAAAEKARKQL